MQLEAGGIRRTIPFPMTSADPACPKQSSRLGHARDCNARNPIVPQQDAGRLLSQSEPPIASLCSGDI